VAEFAAFRLVSAPASTSNYLAMTRFALLLPLVFASCASLQSPVPPGTKARDHGKIGATEGPVWKEGSLYFTDGEHINRLGPNGRTTVFRDQAQSHASNGLLFDPQGRLIACESKARRVTRTEKDGRITVLASRYQGHRFNSPNDLALDSQGRIYFTDPRYGPRTGMEIRDAQGRAIEGVYRIDAPGKVTRIEVPGIERPNGILIGPGDRHLYICDNNNDTHGGSRKLVRFDLTADGTAVKAGSAKVLFDWRDSRGPDGMKRDTAGRLYVAGGLNHANEYETTAFKAGCYILSAGGRLLDFLPTAPDEACNCAFGGPDRKTLFITSGKHLWSLPVNATGWSAE